MTEHDWQTIIGHVPSKSNNYKIIYKGGHPSIDKSESVKKYEQDFYMQIGKYRNMMISGFFELHIRAYFETMSPDLDNCLKTVLDCLQYTKTIKNDNKCVKIIAEKFIDKNNPRIEFRLVEI